LLPASRVRGASGSSPGVGCQLTLQLGGRGGKQAAAQARLRQPQQPQGWPPQPAL
jgi:hypothetical protein